MSPYAALLGSDSPAEIIPATPARLQALFGAIPPERRDAPPAPGKWSPREILVHLADTEIAFAFRLRQALAEENHVIQPFDQDRWMAVSPTHSAESALATFSALRAWNVALIQALSPDQLARPLSHPERGALRYQTLVETVAGHDRNHLRQLEAIAGIAAP